MDDENRAAVETTIGRAFDDLERVYKPPFVRAFLAVAIVPQCALLLAWAALCVLVVFGRPPDPQVVTAFVRAAELDVPFVVVVVLIALVRELLERKRREAALAALRATIAALPLASRIAACEELAARAAAIVAQAQRPRPSLRVAAYACATIAISVGVILLPTITHHVHDVVPLSTIAAAHWPLTLAALIVGAQQADFVKRCRTFATDADLAAYDLRRGVQPAMDAFA